jgi:hypothetical protein
MSGREWKRREFIKVLMSLPVGYYAAGCAVDSGTTAQDPLGKLVLALGPWSDGERERAEEFVGRFLAAEQIVGLYLPESRDAIESLSARYPDDAMAVGELDLASLSEAEREFVVPFVQQLYSLIEVRFDIANEPRWGECLGERTRYTQAPG